MHNLIQCTAEDNGADFQTPPPPPSKRVRHGKKPVNDVDQAILQLIKEKREARRQKMATKKRNPHDEEHFFGMEVAESEENVSFSELFL